MTESAAYGDEMTESAAYDNRWDRGLAVRQAVLGVAHVERAMGSVTNFAKPMQDLVVEYCWGTIWAREGIERGVRSLVNIAMLTALNRNTELAIHVRGAITNGCTPTEIQEVLMQTAIYVGVPAALESFRVAEGVLQELGEIGRASSDGTSIHPE